jgi:alpha-galactosidase
VIFENCSSGGRRIDLGTLARSHCSFTSDQFRDKHLIRYQFSGANTVLPGSRLLNAFCKGMESYSSYEWHANFGGMIVISEEIESWSAERKQQARQHLEAYKSVRQYLARDFHPLFPQPQSLLEWDGWQFHDPASGEGFVLLFRVQSPAAKASPRLQGLAPEQQYLFVDPYTGAERLLSGAELVGEGLSVELPVNGTCLLRYGPR